MKRLWFVILIFYFFQCDGIFSDDLLRIVDGDTLELKENGMIRYIGLDAPEVRKKTKTGWQYHPEPYALEAKQYNKDFIDHHLIQLEFDQEHNDRYGRTLAYVFINQKMINEEMLKQGLATLLLIEPNVKYTERFILAQRSAMQKRQGVWNNLNKGLISLAKVKEYQEQSCQIQVQVQTIKQYANRMEWWLQDMDNFCLIFLATRWPFFYKNNFDLKKDWRNKKFIVSGFVTDYHKQLVMSMDDPMQFELIETKEPI